MDAFDDELPVDGNALRYLSADAERALAIQNEIDALTEQLENRKRDLFELLYRVLPDKFAQAGVRGIDMPTGHRIEINQMVQGGLPKEPDDRRKAFDLLRKLGRGDIIKNEVSVLLDKGADNLAGEVARRIEELGLEPDRRETVHPQTLLAVARDILSGDEGPQFIDVAPVLGLYIANVAKIKEPKRRRNG